MIASYFIIKDKESMQPVTNIKTKRTKNKSQLSQEPALNKNLNGYSHLNVDRFAVLCDIWTNEINFLEMKKNVIKLFS